MSEPVSLQSLQHNVVLTLLNFPNSADDKWYLNAVLTCMSLIVSEVTLWLRTIFIYIYIYFVNCLFTLFAHLSFVVFLKNFFPHIFKELFMY